MIHTDGQKAPNHYDNHNILDATAIVLLQHYCSIADPRPLTEKCSPPDKNAFSQTGQEPSDAYQILEVLRMVSKYLVSMPDSRVKAMRPVRAISMTPTQKEFQQQQRKYVGNNVTSISHSRDIISWGGYSRYNGMIATTASWFRCEAHRHSPSRRDHMGVIMPGNDARTCESLKAAGDGHVSQQGTCYTNCLSSVPE